MRPLLVAVALAAVACGHNVGDSCVQNVDCSPLGDRFCDTASPGGYCTVEGCSLTSCPSEAVCIRFFEPIADEPCDPTHVPSGCSNTERCLCDCGDDPAHPGYCLPAMHVQTTGGGGVQTVCGQGTMPGDAVAHCAPEATERRWCMLRCSSDSDCRDSRYECRQTGSLGSEPVADHTVTIGCDGGGGESVDGGCIPAIVPVGQPDKFCVAKMSM